MMGRPKALLELTSDETEQLERWVRRRKSAQGLALRSQIVLSCATGLTNKEVAAQLGVSMPTVGKWRSRFIDSRLDGLVDEPRSGRKPTITAQQVEDVVVATLESTPEHATHWSRKKMAERSGCPSPRSAGSGKGSASNRTWSTGSNCPPTPCSWDKVYDVVGLYLNPPEAAVVLCVDEKSQVQALEGRSRHSDDARHARKTHPRLRPQRHHQPVRRVQHRRRHRHLQPAPTAPLHRVQEVLTKIDAEVPADLAVHLICDNYSTHKTPAVKTWLQATRGSRSTSPNIFQLAQPSRTVLRVRHRRLLQRSHHNTVQQLEADIRAWIKDWNTHPKPFIWTKSADEILESLRRLLKRISGAGH